MKQSLDNLSSSVSGLLPIKNAAEKNCDLPSQSSAIVENDQVENPLPSKTSEKENGKVADFPQADTQSVNRLATSNPREIRQSQAVLQQIAELRPAAIALRFFMCWTLARFRPCFTTEKKASSLEDDVTNV